MDIPSLVQDVYVVITFTRCLCGQLLQDVYVVIAFTGCLWL